MNHEQGDIEMTEDQVLERVRAELARMKVPGAEQAGLDMTWQDLDVDSLELVELVQALEDAYGIRIADEELKPIKTVGDAARLVVRLSEGAQAPA
jgi:acyl carrier protein